MKIIAEGGPRSPAVFPPATPFGPIFSLRRVGLRTLLLAGRVLPGIFETDSRLRWDERCPPHARRRLFSGFREGQTPARRRFPPLRSIDFAAIPRPPTADADVYDRRCPDAMSPSPSSINGAVHDAGSTKTLIRPPKNFVRRRRRFVFGKASDRGCRVGDAGTLFRREEAARGTGTASSMAPTMSRMGYGGGGGDGPSAVGAARAPCRYVRRCSMWFDWLHTTRTTANAARMVDAWSRK